MRTPRVFIASLVAALAVLVSTDRASQHIVTGTIGDVEAGEWMSVSNEQTDPAGFRIALRETVYEGDPGAIKPGVRVTVWYKGVGERHPVADKVRVLPGAARP